MGDFPLYYDSGRRGPSFGKTEPCGFCKNRPVGNARSWSTGKPEPQPACPRCGKRYDENGNEL